MVTKSLNVFRNRRFRFALIMDSAIKRAPEVYEWRINGQDVLPYYDEEDGCFRFELAHGDFLEAVMPRNVTYRVIEENEDYITSIRTETAQSETMENGNIHFGTLEEDTALTFINERSVAIPTRVSLGLGNWSLVGLPLLAALLMMIMRRMLN